MSSIYGDWKNFDRETGMSKNLEKISNKLDRLCDIQEKQYSKSGKEDNPYQKIVEEIYEYVCENVNDTIRVVKLGDMIINLKEKKVED